MKPSDTITILEKKLELIKQQMIEEDRKYRMGRYKNVSLSPQLARRMALERMRLNS